MRRVLVTGFEPFGGSSDNPSMRVVQALRDAPPREVDLATGILPVAWRTTCPALRSLVARSRPDAIVLLGQSARRPVVTAERFALNFGQGRIADNAGEVRPPGPLVEGAPLALACTLDADACVQAIEAEGLSAAASHDAGAFLCNAALFDALLHALPGQRATFIHLPMHPEQDGRPDGEPTMPLRDAERAVRAVLRALAAGRLDAAPAPS
ncbi:MAG: pyrrolidone-carboxylate peptidase [Phycisphaerales bacterium]|nr:MAG: pyrrolidone-carboxylate peptidase [Phycisphaerales bacterium]